MRKEHYCTCVVLQHDAACAEITCKYRQRIEEERGGKEVVRWRQ
jgi:hypothetical protein